MHRHLPNNYVKCLDDNSIERELKNKAWRIPVALQSYYMLKPCYFIHQRLTKAIVCYVEIMFQKHNVPPADICWEN